MNRRKTTIIIIILILSISAIAVYNYMLSIYEVIYTVLPADLYADNKSEATIMAIPINAIGRKALFRYVKASYMITEGRELVDIVETDKSKGLLRIKAKDKTGIVKIIAKSPYALLPSPIDIHIYPIIAAVKENPVTKEKGQ